MRTSSLTPASLISQPSQHSSPSPSHSLPQQRKTATPALFTSSFSFSVPSSLPHIISSVTGRIVTYAKKHNKEFHSLPFCGSTRPDKGATEHFPRSVAKGHRHHRHLQPISTIHTSQHQITHPTRSPTNLPHLHPP